MIPIHDENPVRRKPVVTRMLIAVNIAAFVLLTPSAFGSDGSWAATCRDTAFFQRFGAIPQELLTLEPLRIVATGEAGVDLRGNPGCYIGAPDYHKQVLVSAVVAMFLHGGWAHLLGNMLFLFVFGNNVEDLLGRVRFLFFYLGCGIAATYGFALVDAGGTEPMVGASGAIAGVLGAYVVLWPRAKVWGLLPIFVIPIPLRVPAWLLLGGWFVLQAMYSTGSGVSDAATVAYAAHVIGFLVGAAVVWHRRPRRTPPPPPAWGYPPGTGTWGQPVTPPPGWGPPAPPAGWQPPPSGGWAPQPPGYPPPGSMPPPRPGTGYPPQPGQGYPWPTQPPAPGQAPPPPATGYPRPPYPPNPNPNPPNANPNPPGQYPPRQNPPQPGTGYPPQWPPQAPPPQPRR